MNVTGNVPPIDLNNKAGNLGRPRQNYLRGGRRSEVFSSSEKVKIRIGRRSGLSFTRRGKPCKFDSTAGIPYPAALRSSPPPPGQLELITSVSHRQCGVDELPMIRSQHEPDGSFSIKEAARIIDVPVEGVRRVCRIIRAGRADIGERLRDWKLTIEEAERGVGQLRNAEAP